MKKKSILALLAVVAFGVGFVEAEPTLTVQNTSNKPIVATVTHRFCRFRGKVNDILKLGADKGTKALAQKLEIAKKAEGKSTTKQQLMKEAKGLWDALVGGKGEACGVETIKPNTNFKFAVKTRVSGIIKGFSLTINDADGKVLVAKQPDIKRDTTATFNGRTLYYVDKLTGENKSKNIVGAKEKNGPQCPVTE